jgi:signal peptidase II
MKLKNLNWLWLSVIIIIIDQITKVIVSNHIPLGSGIQITPFFNLVNAQNFGAAFSFLDTPGGHQRWMFSVVSLLVSIGLIIWLLRVERSQHWRAAALALVIGGALGNFWDRFSVGYVVDFLDFHLGNYHWPAFNVADTAVCIGAAILIINLMQVKK